MTNFYIGQVVRNLGEILAVVVDVRETDLILRHLWNDGFTWRADKANCEPADNSQTALRHNTGLVSLG
jgi:hypothetical protein